MTIKARAKAIRDSGKVALTRSPWLYNHLRRAYALARFYMHRPHEADYGAFSLFPNRDGAFLDVGANAGMSAFSFRIYNKTSPIVCVEPNPYHERDLRFTARFVAPLTYRITAAGEHDGQMTLHVPVFRGVPLSTEASLIARRAHQSPSLRWRLGRRMHSAEFHVEELTVPVIPLDRLELETAFVKLDVQGFEYQALLGLERTLRRCRPVLLIETANPDIIAWLADRGYTTFSYDKRKRRLIPEMRGANVVFVHEQDLEAVV